MTKFLKFAILLLGLSLGKISSYAEELNLFISGSMEPDEFEGYGIPGNINMFVYAPSEDVFVPANVLQLVYIMPANMELDALIESVPAGFEYVYVMDQYVYFQNTSDLLIEGGEFFEFNVPITPSGEVDGDIQIQLMINPEIVTSYTITESEGENFYVWPVSVPDVELEPLSVQFVSVYANADNNCAVNVNWTVSATDAASYEGIQYAVERLNNRVYEQIAVITPQAGQFSMNYVDQNAIEGMNMYRIAQITRDGKVAYSQTVKANVTCTPGQHIKIYPNPAVDFVSISGVKAGQKVRVFGINGVEIYSIDVQQDNQVIQVNDLPAGAYNVNVSQNGTSVFNGKLIKR
ncbi:MAG: T9SS type A sorting domain-containing protein [Taibaiella sp.]|nr:T9SS type A sorting domain-containing protein [Taibaiella sp.]